MRKNLFLRTIDRRARARGNDWRLLIRRRYSALLGDRTRDSSAMSATETVTGTARNTNPVDALRCTPNANVVFTGRARERSRGTVA